MNLSSWSIRRPVAVTMVVLGFVVIGLVSLVNIGLDWLPPISFPTVAILAQYEEAAPEEVEEQITQPLEGIISAADGVKNVSSISMSGMCIITAEFGWGSNMDVAGQNVREKIDMVRDFLPKDMPPPLVMKFDPSQMPIMYFGLSSEVSPIGDLKSYAQDMIRPRLEGVEGVAIAGVLGGLDDEISVAVDQDKLELYDLSILQVVNAIALENINMSAGRMELNQREYHVRTVGRFSEFEDVANVVVAVSSDGTPVYIKDIATVIPGQVERRSYVRMDGKSSIGIPVLKQSGTNTVLVARAVTKEVEAIQKELPTVNFTKVFDLAEFINMSLQAIKDNAVYGSILTFFFLLWFLHDFRASSIIFISVPTCVIVTFMMMYFGKVTANMMSLGGFALGLGMLVDNAIIVLENTYRHLEMGKSPVQAADDGAGEVGLALSASTITTLVVFFPIAYIGGLAGQLFKDLAVTVCFSLMASWLIAISLIPMICARVLKSKGVEHEGLVLKTVRYAQNKALRWALVHRWKTVFMAVALLLVSVIPIYPLKLIPLELLPKTPGEEFLATARLPVGTTLEDTNRAMKFLEGEIRKIPEIEHVFCSIGVSESSKYDAASGMGPQDVNEAQFFGLFRKGVKRVRSDDVILNDVRAVVKKVPGLTANVMSINDALLSSMRMAELEIKFWGEDLNKLMEVTQRAVVALKDAKGVANPETPFTKGKGEINVELDRQLAANNVISTGVVGQTVKTATLGTVAGRYKSGDYEADIRVRLKPSQRDDPSDLLKLRVSSLLGGSIPLEMVATVEQSTAPAKIYHDSQRRVARVDANLEGQTFFLGDTVGRIKEVLSKMGLPKGYTYTIEGQWKELQIAMKSSLYAFIMAVLLTYMVMAFQFESLVVPLVIMVAVPLSSIGVIGGLLLFNKTLCVTAFIGVVMLVGVAVDDSIILLDFVRQLRDEGVQREEALLMAGEKRVRAILLCTVTTIVGMLPTAMGLGGRGAALQAPLAAAFLSGLTAAMVQTLVVIPVLYAMAEDGSLWVQRHIFRRNV